MKNEAKEFEQQKKVFLHEGLTLQSNLSAFSSGCPSLVWGIRQSGSTWGPQLQSQYSPSPYQQALQFHEEMSMQVPVSLHFARSNSPHP